MLRNWVAPVLSSVGAALFVGAASAYAVQGNVTATGPASQECVVVTPDIILPTVTISPSPSASPTPSVSGSPSPSVSPTQVELTPTPSASESVSESPSPTAVSTETGTESTETPTSSPIAEVDTNGEQPRP